MNPVIEAHLRGLTDLCRHYNVERLEVFGSAATGRFDPDHSDIDLLVTFGPCGEIGEFRQYIDFLLDCENLFGRRVDLVEEVCIRNPYFRQSVDASRTLLYAT